MKKIHLQVATLLSILISSYGYGQSLAPQILTQFPAAVVVKVHEISTYVRLSADKQLALAAFFRQEDSLAATMVAAGKPLSEIDRLRSSGEDAGIKQVLSPAEYDSYANARYIAHARREGLLMAKLATDKYHCDNATAIKLRDLYFSRNLASERLYGTGRPDAASSDGSLSGDVLYADVRRWDSLIDRYVPAAAGGAYIRKKIAQLDRIRPLQQQQKTALQENFTRLCQQMPEDSYADDFNEAMHMVIVDTLYYARIYQDAIARKSLTSAKGIVRELEKKNKLTKDGVNSIFPIVAERERRLAVLQTAFTVDNATRDSLYRSVNELYDSLIRIAMLRDGVSPTASQFTIAVRERKALGLSAAQVDALLANAAELEKMKDAAREKDPLGKFDSKPFETEHMLQIVSEDQYRSVLIVKNRSQARADAEADWQEMQQRNLAANLNKDSTLRQLNDYYLAKWVMYYRYGNDKIKQAANVKDVFEHMPHALRVLTSARKYNNPTTTVLGEYQTGKQ